jgi:hypothetical protein
MTITIDLTPDVERDLLAQAAERGVSVTELVNELVVRQSRLTSEHSPRRTGEHLIDACAKVRGLLSDEEIETLFRRTPSFARPVSFE